MGKYNIEDVATPQAWKKNPNLVTDFYNIRRKQIMDALPNEAHCQIASWEEFFEVTVVTQNIDDLHERAGSSNVLHLDGNIRLAKSSGPNQEKRFYPISNWELTADDLCEEGYPLRPHVVWFGEEVPAFGHAAEIIRESDLLLVIGTSLQVYPAAGLIHEAPVTCRKIIVDPKVEEYLVPKEFEKIQGSAAEVLKQIDLY